MDNQTIEGARHSLAIVANTSQLALSAATKVLADLRGAALKLNNGQSVETEIADSIYALEQIEGHQKLILQSSTTTAQS
jgi:hypothetical protein